MYKYQGLMIQFNSTYILYLGILTEKPPIPVKHVSGNDYD